MPRVARCGDFRSAQFPADDLDVVADGAQVLPAPGGEASSTRTWWPRRDQRLGEMTADEAAPPVTRILSRFSAIAPCWRRPSGTERESAGVGL